MNVFEVVFTPQAEEQLEDIAHYIAVELRNPIAAEKFIDELVGESLKLSHNPEKHRLIDEEPWGKRGIRKIKVDNYYAYFWIDAENATVWIIGVVFAKRDQKKYLSTVDVDN